MNRSKVEEQRENKWLFKGKLAQKSWAIDAVMGADLMRRGSGFHWAALWLQSRAEFGLILLPKEPRSHHDRDAIGPRSGVDRDFGASEIAVRCSGKDYS